MKWQECYYVPTVRTVNLPCVLPLSCAMVHWGNKNTQKYQYRTDAPSIQTEYKRGKHQSVPDVILYRFLLVRCWYWIVDYMKEAKGWIRWFFERVCFKIGKVIHQ